MNVPSISLIIPCYNESARIDLMFEGIQEFDAIWKGAYEVILVDDGSNDGTDVLIKNHSVYIEFLQSKKILFIQQENRGKGGALKFGVAYATKEFVLTLDADMASKPIELLHWYALRKTFLSNDEF